MPEKITAGAKEKQTPNVKPKNLCKSMRKEENEDDDI
jgi:hypothetical protein